MFMKKRWKHGVQSSQPCTLKLIFTKFQTLVGDTLPFVYCEIHKQQAWFFYGKLNGIHELTFLDGRDKLNSGYYFPLERKNKISATINSQVLEWNIFCVLKKGTALHLLVQSTQGWVLHLKNDFPCVDSFKVHKACITFKERLSMLSKTFLK